MLRLRQGCKFVIASGLHIHTCETAVEDDSFGDMHSTCTAPIGVPEQSLPAFGTKTSQEPRYAHDIYERSIEVRCLLQFEPLTQL